MALNGTQARYDGIWQKLQRSIADRKIANKGCGMQGSSDSALMMVIDRGGGIQIEVRLRDGGSL